MKTFTSADGSTRCRACHLHPDMCTCSPEHPVRQILARTIIVRAPLIDQDIADAASWGLPDPRKPTP